MCPQALVETHGAVNHSATPARPKKKKLDAMRFTHNEVNFDVTCGVHQKFSIGSQNMFSTNIDKSNCYV